jgi:two-component system, sensor histidine kinase RegB
MQHVLRNDREVMRWLIRQRWIAVGGQATAVLVAVFGFGMSFAFLPVAGGILLLAISNHFVVPESDHARGIGRRMGQVLAFDVGLLTWMLHWTGGGTNPFVLFYLLHVVLAAMFLGPRALGVILLAATAGYIWVTGFSPPFRETSAWVNDGQLVPELAAWGARIAIALVAGILALLVFSMRRAQLAGEKELRESAARLAELERFKSLATLAAGVAHELGTPLGTIAVAAKELEFLINKHPSQQDLMPGICEDARLIRGEVERCRTILKRLDHSSTAKSGYLKAPVALRDIPSILRERLPPHHAARLQACDRIPGAKVILPLDAVLQSLIVLVENACEADTSNHPVEFSIDAIDNQLWMRVIDRGPGISEQARRRVGEPYFTTKQASGKGLGLFLVRTLTVELGGEVSLERIANGGTCATLKIPIEIL